MTATIAERKALVMFGYTNRKSDIGSVSGGLAPSVGHYLGSVIDVVDHKLTHRGSAYRKHGGLDGELWVAHKRVRDFRSERHPGIPGATNVLGDDRVQVYDVVVESTNGITQYVTVVADIEDGAEKSELLAKLSEKGLAMNNTRLAGDDRNDNFSSVGFWAEGFVDIPSI